MKNSEKRKIKVSYKKVYNICEVIAKSIIPNKKRIKVVIKKARSIFERLHNIPRLDILAENICCFCDMLSDYLEGTYSHFPLSTVTTVLAGLIYVVLPFDALPDIIPLLGWSDDTLVMATVLGAMQNDINEYLSWKEKRVITNEETTCLQLIG